MLRMLSQPRVYEVEVKKYQFKPKGLAPLGLYLLGKLPVNFSSRYNRKLRNKLVNLYGSSSSQVYLEIHWAQKIVWLILLGLGLGIVGLGGEIDISFFMFAGIIGGLLFFWTDKTLDKRILHKQRAILIDLPEFINTLTLLINAGLPFNTAVQKIIQESDRQRPFFQEMQTLLIELNAGKSIQQAYEDLAQRCRVPEVTRFVSTILQNVSRGGSDLVYVLKILAQEAWEKRKDVAKKQGEEAASKLVFPMVMVFLAVAIIVLAPALITMQR